jgi:uncharacterized protein YbgA (DUF1722 family)/uncharacterized protein YbbK (DUF523 family)
MNENAGPDIDPAADQRSADEEVQPVAPDVPLPLRVGVSTCLLGREVRFNGGHKLDHYVTDLLARYFEFVPVCPELEVGMGVPREPVRLVGDPAAPRMVGVDSGEDWTERMNAYARDRVARLERLELSGYILKNRSPSCGMERVKVYTDKGMPTKGGRGLFAAALLDALPLLPVEEEGRLNDAGLRENFVVRVFAYHRLQTLFRGGFQRGEVVAFHAAEKYLLLAHSPAHYEELGRLVARIKQLAPAEFRDLYCAGYMAALQERATVGKNVNVLHHIVGFLRESLSGDARAQILRVIEDYRAELVPLIVPLTLIHHYLQLHGVEYMLNQVYLRPSPKELMLRNHV